LPFCLAVVFHGWTYLVYTNRIRKKGRRRRQSPKKGGYNKKPKGEGFDQERGTSCVHKQYKE
jgi:hypothetical protein